MKVFIVGATGPTGQHLVTEALAKGYEVVAFVRNPDKLTVKDDKLKIVKGNLLDANELKAAMKGCDAVLSAVGSPGGIFTPCDIYTTSGKAFVTAMREAGVKRLVACTAWGTKDDPGLPFMWRWIYRPTFLRNVLGNMSAFEDYLANECSDIVYTCVRPPILTDEPSKGEKFEVREGQCVPKTPDYKTSRQDVAKFMLGCLDTQEYDKKMIAIVTIKAGK